MCIFSATVSQVASPTIAHFGMVLEVNPSGGTVEKRLEGMQVFMDMTEMTEMPDGRLVYSGLHLSGHPAPPHVGISWGVGIKKTGFYNQRKLSWNFILPPYTYRQVNIQQ